MSDEEGTTEAQATPAVTTIPFFPPFVPDSDPASTGPRWTKWKKRFENFMVAMNVTEPTRKRALLLHYVGETTYDIFDTLQETGEAADYNTAIQKLSHHFTPKKNVDYEIYVFRQEKQRVGETLDQYATRLRKLANTCEFDNLDRELKSQITLGCLSSRLRRRALRESALSLDQLLTLGRTMETAEKQASNIEQANTDNHEINRTRQERQPRPTQQQRLQSNAGGTNQSQRKCFNCGNNYPHINGRCPAQGKTCRLCQKMNHFARCCRSMRRNADNIQQVVPETEITNYQKATVSARQAFPSTQPSVVDSSSDDEYAFTTQSQKHVTRKSKMKSPKVHVNINNTPREVVIDTGASVDIIDQATFSRIQKHLRKIHRPPIALREAKTKVYGYGAEKPLDIAGKFETEIESSARIIPTTVYVMKGTFDSLLSYETAVELELVKLNINATNDKPQAETETKLQQLLKQHDDRFHGIGKLKESQVHLHIDESVTPVAQPHRRIPFHMRKKLEQELTKLEDSGIIEEVHGPTPWVSPLVVTPKPKDPSKVRLCVDMRVANKAIQRERHITPTIDDLVNDLNGSTVFSKLDLNQGYHQLELDPNSRYITTFSTHKGLRRYTRLPFGVTSAAEVFQATINQILEDIPGTRNISDDIIVYGPDQKSHDHALEAVLQRLREKNLTLNKKKCEFNKSSREFYGYIFSKDGVSLDPNKIAAFQNISAPQNPTEVRSLLGMANYCSRFIPNFSTITEPLRQLTKSNVKWEWTNKHQEAVDMLKKHLTDDKTISYFDPKSASTIVVDASPVGLGAIFIRTHPQSKEKKLIAFASRALNPVEQRYSQTEREALAILWACEHFHLYVYGSHFTVITDHKPLEHIHANPRSRSSARLERWALKLQQYDFTVKYEPGQSNPADYMSRHPPKSVPSTCYSQMADEYVHFVAQHAAPKAISLDEVKAETAYDPTLQHLTKAIRTGNWTVSRAQQSRGVNEKEIQAYFKLRHEITVSIENNVLLKGTRIILPASLRSRALSLAHEGHQGLVKTKCLLREKVWFPSIDAEAKSMIERCIPCQAATPTKHNEPLQMTSLPNGPWQELSADFCGPLPDGNYVLVVIDEFSRYPEIEILKSTSAKATIPKRDKIMSTHGVPIELKTDNGPPFQSHEFDAFLQDLGFNHRKVTPLWPKANGEAERLCEL